jgi:hypothetical protein
MNAARGSAAKPLEAAQAVNGPLTRLQEMLPPAAPATAAARAVATAEAAGAAAVFILHRNKGVELMHAMCSRCDVCTVCTLSTAVLLLQGLYCV